MPESHEFHVPVRPYDPIAAHNRAAAARGSPRYADLAAHADYNGHHVTVSWNEYRGYYVAEYYWAGRVVLARGSFATCLRAALDEYARGALGASVGVYVPQEDAEALAIARSTAELVPGSAWETTGDGRRKLRAPWWTWRHEVAVEGARDADHPRAMVLIFDWPLCQTTATRQEYEAALKAKYGRTHQ